MSTQNPTDLRSPDGRTEHYRSVVAALSALAAELQEGPSQRRHKQADACVSAALIVAAALDTPVPVAGREQSSATGGPSRCNCAELAQDGRRCEGHTVRSEPSADGAEPELLVTERWQNDGLWYAYGPSPDYPLLAGSPFASRDEALSAARAGTGNDDGPQQAKAADWTEPKAGNTASTPLRHRLPVPAVVEPAKALYARVYAAADSWAGGDPSREPYHAIYAAGYMDALVSGCAGCREREELIAALSGCDVDAVRAALASRPADPREPDAWKYRSRRLDSVGNVCGEWSVWKVALVPLAADDWFEQQAVPLFASPAAVPIDAVREAREIIWAAIASVIAKRETPTAAAEDAAIRVLALASREPKQKGDANG